jgi:hypothetical protein
VKGLNFPKQDITKKIFEFAKEIAKLYDDEKGKKEIINLLRTHFYFTGDGHLHLSINSIHKLIMGKAWQMYQENESIAFSFSQLPIFEQLQIIQSEIGLDQKIFKNVEKEVSPWIAKFVKLGKQIPNPFGQKWIISTNRSQQNTYNYNLLINKSKKLGLLESDKGMITLNYYLMLIEGAFEDKIDFIFALIFLVNGKISIPHKGKGKSKEITKIEGILDKNFNFTLGWKKEGLKYYKMPYLSKCLDNELRNQIAHLKYEINEKGQIFLEDGTELKDLFDKQTELMHVIASINEIILKLQLDVIKPGMEEILRKITETVKSGNNPWA